MVFKVTILPCKHVEKPWISVAIKQNYSKDTQFIFSGESWYVKSLNSPKMWNPLWQSLIWSQNIPEKKAKIHFWSVRGENHFFY